jgi:hypothetical protein
MYQHELPPSFPTIKYNPDASLSFFAIAIRLQFSHIDGTGHQRVEILQRSPFPVVQPYGWQTDRCLTTSAFYSYGNR